MQIIRPTEKIEVIESKKQCKAGSTGYLAYQQPLDIYNMCKSLIVFTKFGDKGKNRIEVMNTVTEMVDIASMKLTTKARETLKERITGSSIMPKHPDKYYTINLSMKKTPMLSKNIINLDIWDFFGYICSLSLFVKYLSTNNARLSLPGKDGLSIMDVSQTHIVDVPPTDLANFIYLALSSRGPNLDGEGVSSLYMDHFNSTHNRVARLNDMYLLLSTLRGSVLRYSNYIIASHRDMNSRIKSAIANKKGGSKLKTIGGKLGESKIKIEQIELAIGEQVRPHAHEHRTSEVADDIRDMGRPRAVRDEGRQSRSSSSRSAFAEVIRPLRTAGTTRAVNVNMGTWEMRHREEEVTATEEENR